MRLPKGGLAILRKMANRPFLYTEVYTYRDVYAALFDAGLLAKEYGAPAGKARYRITSAGKDAAK